VPVIETPLYLPWLAAGLRARGVAFERRALASFEETRGFDALVNCTGWARASCAATASASPCAARSRACRAARSSAR
jgi:D-amino-acid oxidase